MKSNTKLVQALASDYVNKRYDEATTAFKANAGAENWRKLLLGMFLYQQFIGMSKDKRELLTAKLYAAPVHDWGVYILEVAGDGDVTAFLQAVFGEEARLLRELL